MKVKVKAKKKKDEQMAIVHSGICNYVINKCPCLRHIFNTKLITGHYTIPEFIKPSVAMTELFKKMIKEFDEYEQNNNQEAEG